MNPITYTYVYFNVLFGYSDKINAIKLLRTLLNNTGLKETKDFVEKYSEITNGDSMRYLRFFVTPAQFKHLTELINDQHRPLADGGSAWPCILISAQTCRDFPEDRVITPDFTVWG